MSDFGTKVLVRRSDAADITAADTIRVKQIAKELVFGTGDRVSDYADFELRFGESQSPDGGEGLFVSLTAYSTDDFPNENGLEDEAAIARDTPLAEQFGRELQSLLGQDFTVEVSSSFW